MAANFDRIARAYRWLEYLSFGRALERCRFYRLDRERRVLGSGQRALVMGDGDGRFLARLLRQNPHLYAEAVDFSPAMLDLLSRRAAAEGAGDRITVRCEDARRFTPSGEYDLVATHFFLDCLTTAEILALAARIRPHLPPGAVWIVSDFAIPRGAGALPSRIVVSFLYLSFRLLTGLQVRRLPRHDEALRQAGLSLADRREWLGGLLFSELWRLEATGREATERRQSKSH
jgi:SAM-dependent methyltransferase